jgi:hypothetical protein
MQEIIEVRGKKLLKSQKHPQIGIYGDHVIILEIIFSRKNDKILHC